MPRSARSRLGLYCALLLGKRRQCRACEKTRRCDDEEVGQPEHHSAGWRDEIVVWIIALHLHRLIVSASPPLPQMLRDLPVPESNESHRRRFKSW